MNILALGLDTDMGKPVGFPQWVVGFNMGTGKPMVFPKWVLQVWVWSWILAHCSTPCICTVVLWVYTG